jgi:cholesterol oxidase
MEDQSNHFDYIIVGSGFGGAVSALRLTEKGYRVLVLEQGKRFSSKDFPKTNWNLRKWLWMPALGWKGFFRIDRFRHLAVLSGTGLGGGSLVYAGTLAVPDENFFRQGSWASLADWQNELKPFYEKACGMLGGETNPGLRDADHALQDLARKIGREGHFQPVTASAYFDEKEVTVPDPYFGGAGPDRAGCRFCGGCMVGCRHNAKNTLDKNYLYLAEQLGATVITGAKVRKVTPLDPAGRSGYSVKWTSGKGIFKKDHLASAQGVVLAAGVLGTVGLLLDMKRQGILNLSEKTGREIRTNNESLIGVVSRDRGRRFSDGLAIGSILDLGNHVHAEPVRYPEGSGFFRALALPMVKGSTLRVRMLKVLVDLVIHPRKNFSILLKPNIALHTVILMVMQQKDIALELTLNGKKLKTKVNGTEIPTAFIPEAEELAGHYASLVNGKILVLAHETLFGTPTTAHIFGGAVMAKDRKEGVIDSQNRVFGYDNLYVCDGSMISANPGVNPSLTIAAITERAMSQIPDSEF